MQKIQLIYDEDSKNEYLRVLELSDRLSTLAENCEIWYSDARTQELMKFTDIIYDLLKSLHSQKESSVTINVKSSKYANHDEPESEL